MQTKVLKKRLKTQKGQVDVDGPLSESISVLIRGSECNEVHLIPKFEN